MKDQIVFQDDIGLKTEQNHVHLAHFYDAGVFPDRSIADFIWTGLQRDENAVIIATREHTDAIQKCLASNGAATDALEWSGRLTVLDAHATLEQCLENGLVNRPRFFSIVGTALDRAAIVSNGRGRAFGELVALLGEQGKIADAIELERLWNELLSKRSFRLYCAYPIGQFGRESLAELFHKVCDEHDEVIPVLSWLNRPELPGRELAMLQQQARALEVEINERKRAEAALAEERSLLEQRVKERTAELAMANTELTKALHIKDEFLASMSHELRTPLNTILAMSEALQERVYGELTERQLNVLRGIEESGHHLLSLINDILDLFKMDADKLQLEKTVVHVEPICDASLRLVAQLATNKRLKVNTTLDSRVTTIAADARRLKQILVNLLNNAVKFTPEGGAIGLEVIGNPKQELVHFTVWDTGIGIAPEDLSKLFQPFVQLDNRLSRQYNGTGMGLVLVQRMVELHGGRVAVESPAFPAEAFRNGAGKGSRFTVSLPWEMM